MANTEDEQVRLRRKLGSEPPWLIVTLVVVVVGLFGAGLVGVGVMAWVTLVTPAKAATPEATSPPE